MGSHIVRTSNSDIKSSLEKHFKDVVYLEFIIQDGKLWVINARPANITGKANLKITTDLFFEKVIDINEAISRLRFRDIEEVLLPTIHNEKELKIIGTGVPASPGAATGRVFFFSDDITRRKGKNCILCRKEVSPEDVEGILTSKGVITSRGGMTSHAALVSRGFGKTCISGIGSLNVNYNERSATINGYIIKEGDWITINGNNGHLYKGKGHFITPNLNNDKHLYVFSRIIEKAICTNVLKANCIGKAWILRDNFLHNIPLRIPETDKKCVDMKKYVSFNHPKPSQIKNIYKNLNKITPEIEDLKLIIKGLRNSLLRQLANKIGIGNHYKYYRPILDPMLCINVKSPQIGCEIKNQLIGEEFFHISKYLPTLIDIYKVKIFMEIQTNSDNGLSFLDFTNPKGESIVLKDSNVIRYHIEINNQSIESDRLPLLYNIFRKREYFWTWYSENMTSHKEIVDFLKKSKSERIENFRLNTYAHELELLENDSFTNSGKALIL